MRELPAAGELGTGGPVADKPAGSKAAALSYRPEIDGLRAVAVVPVILFHAAVPGFSGGYIGVDVFFVISGFLITSIIAADLQRGSFSLRHFYERRARRILPALLFVILCCLPFAWLWMLPDDLENFGQSIVATVLFSNNVLQTLTSGYWDQASEFKPLLHTWSLGIEEQYYLVAPLLLIVLWRFSRSYLLPVLAALGLASFLAAAYAQVVPLDAVTQASVFYLLPTRAWELLIGAVAALLSRRRWLPNSNVRWSDACAALGIAFIVASIAMIDPSYPFPGPWTLIPTAGTVIFLLFATETGYVSRLLASRAFVIAGLLSYSAYLWHQPVLAFLRVYSTREPGWTEISGAILLTLLLSAFTWHFVEQPFRSNFRTSTKQVFVTSGVVGLLLVSAGFAMHVSRGFPQRLYDAGSVTAEDLHISYNERAFAYMRDRFERLDSANILILGNSFARDFLNMTIETLPTDQVEIIYRSDAGSCVDDFAADLQALYGEANAVVFASGWQGSGCIERDLLRAAAEGKSIFYVGTKDFGYNINWVMRLAREDRANQFNDLPHEVLDYEREAAKRIPADHYIPLLGPIVQDGRIPITDNEGRLLTPDRRHLTQFGAVYLGAHALPGTAYARLFQ